jgi:hypothetical protein
MQLARARSLLGHAISASAEYRRRCREARQEAKREVQRLLEEHQKERREFRLPPLLGEKLEAVIQGFRQRVTASVPFDGATRWSNVCELQDKVRDAEDKLERAKADAARADLEARPLHYGRDRARARTGPLPVRPSGARQGCQGKALR